jgi:hypothetical protein
VAFHPANLRHTIDGQKKRNSQRPYNELYPIPGTTVADAPMDTPRFLLSCLYFHGFDLFEPKVVFNFTNKILKLIEPDERDERLRTVVDQLLTLKLSASASDSSVLREIGKLDAFNGITEEWTEETLEKKRQDLPPVIWKGGVQTFGYYQQTSRGASRVAYSEKVRSGQVAGRKRKGEGSAPGKSKQSKGDSSCILSERVES